MNWNERIQAIYKILNGAGKANVIDQMIAVYGIGGTVGEQFSIICTWLAKLRNHDRETYGLIKEHADFILQEGINIKYFTESYYKKQ